MPKRSIILCAVTAVLMPLLIGCANNNEGGTFYVSKRIGPTDALVTSPDVRLVMSTPSGTGEGGKPLERRRILCAEPSPDVVKAVQNSFGFGGSLGIAIPAQASGAVALSIAKARAEAAAQLGERLATIQLLRDGLYRACEAYANGAINKIGYAVLLSRYDDTMVTMLLGELAAGAFGRSLATASGTTESSGSGSADLLSALSIADGMKQVTEATKAEAEKAEKEAADAQAKAEKDKTEASKNQAGEKKQEAKIKLTTAANAKAAAAAIAAGAIEPKQNPLVAEHIRHMQRKYLENINSDALIVACISAMNDNEKNTNNSKFISLCGNEKNGIIVSTMKKQGEFLDHLIGRANLPHAILNVKNARTSLQQLNKK